MRFFPHLQDTGGFFIAVIKKNKEIDTIMESAPVSSESAPTPVVDAEEEGETSTSTATFLLNESQKRKLKAAVEATLRNFLRTLSSHLLKRYSPPMIQSGSIMDLNPKEPTYENPFLCPTLSRQSWEIFLLDL